MPSPRDRYVLVRPKQVRRIPAALDLRQTLVVGPVRGAGAILAFFFSEEVDVGAAGRKPPQLPPRAACPLDILRLPSVVPDAACGHVVRGHELCG
jgi:hypothetical protein